MRYSRGFFWTIGVTICVTLAAGTALGQWGSAVLEPVSVGPENDEVSESALALDDFGDLHLLYDRISGTNHDLFYMKKPNGGSWSAPVPVGDPVANPSNPRLAVNKVTGEPYAIYLEAGQLKLGYASGGVWTYYDLPTPGVGTIFDPTLTVDGDGNAHVAVIGQPGGVFKMCYGYWDGPISNNFYFQVIRDSQLGSFGSGADPDICVQSGGIVAICYRGGNYLSYQVDVAENGALGGTTWDIQTIPNAGMQCYPGSIKATSNDNLYLAYHGNYGFGFPNDVFFTSKASGAPAWAAPVEVGGSFGGADVSLAMEEDGTAHIVFMETSGNFYTGNIIYTTNLSGSWAAQNLLQNNKYYPSLVVDPQGNCGMAFQEEVTYTDNDVYFYGYVASTYPPDLDVTLTPDNPPIVIPPEGGTFTYTIEVTNNVPLPVLTDVWTDVVLPGGSQQVVLTRFDVALGPNATRTRNFEQNVPGRAQGGTYMYRAFVGSYATMTIVDADSFEFSKSGSGDEGSGAGDWLVKEVGHETTPQTTELVSVSPNPFNPATTISFALPQAGKVTLSVYDVTGKLVSTLANGWREAGSHEVTFDGPGLPSGVYIYRLRAGEFNAAGKMVLIK